MILQLMVTGLAMGSIYALVALGFALIYQALNVVNFAQGEFVMLGAYVFLTLADLVHIPYLLAVPLACIVMALFAYLFQLSAYSPLQNAHFLTIIASTVGVSIVLKNMARIVWGPEPRAVTAALPGDTIVIGSLRLDPQHIVIIISTIALVALLYLFLEKTITGKSMRATAQNRTAAYLMGIRVNRMTSITFILSTILATLAGVLLAPVFFATPTMGSIVGLKGFAATVVGGFGNMQGAIFGGLLLGLVEIFGAAYVSSMYRDAFAFIVLILVLLFWPQGLFGEKISEKV